MPQTREVRVASVRAAAACQTRYRCRAGRHAVCSILITAFDGGQRLQPEYRFRMVVIAELTVTTSGTSSDIRTICCKLAAMSMSSAVRYRGREPNAAVLNELEFCGSSDLSEMDRTASATDHDAIRCTRLASKVH